MPICLEISTIDNPVSLNLITCYFFACCEIAYDFFQPSLDN